MRVNSSRTSRRERASGTSEGSELEAQVPREASMIS